jgi:hypothetical protein
LDAWVICRTFLRIAAPHLAEHFRPSFMGTTKVDRHHLEKASLGLYLTNAQPTVEQLQSLEEITSASWDGDRQGGLGSGQFGSSCCIAAGRPLLVAISEAIIPCEAVSRHFSGPSVRYEVTVVHNCSRQRDTMTTDAASTKSGEFVAAQGIRSCCAICGAVGWVIKAGNGTATGSPIAAARVELTAICPEVNLQSTSDGKREIPAVPGHRS